MPSLLRPRLLAAVAALLGCASGPAVAAPPEPPIPVVLKVDDLSCNQNGDVSPRWKRIIDFALERRIKLSIGVIARSLEGDKPSYIAHLKELRDSGLIELWFHGYDHGVHQADGKSYPEFAHRSHEEQKRRFDLAQRLALEKLGTPFETFGPPGGGNTQASEEDWDNTARIMAETPGMRIWLYPKLIDTRGERLQAAGKVTILDRVWQVNIEQPLFVPNLQKFAEGYTAHASGRRYFILQGHPDMWDDARWAEFVRMIDYLQQNHIPIVTASELVGTLSSATK